MQEIQAFFTTRRTVGETIKAVANFFSRAKLFFGHGLVNGKAEAIYLTKFSIGWSPEAAINKSNQQYLLTTTEQQLLLSLVLRRVEQRIPLPYLTGEAYFAGFKFQIDQRVLIPRCPLAELIEELFMPWVMPDQVNNILEIGTGSGCIAIACAHYFPHTRVTATDIDTGALQVAQNNVDLHGLTDRVKLIQANVFQGVPKETRYDIIISNPPYVGETEFNTLPPEYYHEPSKALVSGEHGDEIALQLLADGANYLTESGVLIIEVGNTAPLIVEKHPKLPLTWLEFTHGEAEVMLIDRPSLKEYFHQN